MTDPRTLAAQLLAQSRYAMSVADAAAHIRERRAALLEEPPTKDPPPFTAEPTPMPHVLSPAEFADAFHAKRAQKPATGKPKTNKPAGRKPVGQLTKKHARFTVIDGAKPGDNPSPRKG